MSDPMVIGSHKGPYEVHFDEGAFDHLDAGILHGTHFVIDRRVAELYRDELSNVLAAPSVLLIEAKEENKSLERFPAYVDHLVNHGIRRDHRLVAIGGGILQDITCFLAATLLRGIEWNFYPTTLLAQADSCIGSKSSINSGGTKNILGTFTPPSRVTLSTRVLETLDERDLRSGVGEMLKVHVIDGPESFDAIAGDYQAIFTNKAIMARYIRRSLEIKKEYIEKDEFDRGPRNVFNYGHSFGHAIEAATHFAIAHGIAVTIGMDMANYVATRLGIGEERNYRRMRPVLRANYRGYEDHPVPREPFFAALAKDKKNLGRDSVTLILPDAEGHVFKDTYPTDDRLHTACAEFLETERRA